MLMGRSHSCQADVIDRAVWTCQQLGLLEVLADDVQQYVNEVAAIWLVLYADSIEERLEGLVDARDRICVAAELLRRPVQLIGANEFPLALDVDAPRINERANKRVCSLSALVQHLICRDVGLRAHCDAVLQMV